MREIYHWTEWFSELANKIAEGGEEILIERAKQIAWKADRTDPSLLLYGDENIDPFSFFYSLAGLAQSQESRNRIYPSINENFNINTSLPLDCDDAFIFPTPDRRNLLFHSNGNGDPQSLWHLFRGAVLGPESVQAQDFDSSLKIPRVAIAKLTQALFLINPSAFLPFDKTGRSLGISRQQKVENWTQYQKELQKFRDAFPGCKPCEINLFIYLWQKGDLPIREYFQVSTNAWGEDRGDFWQDNDPELDFGPNNWVFTGGPRSGVGWEDYYEPRDGAPKYPVRDPRPGDVMLVRTGRWQGRGIGIVYKNDYQDCLAEGSRIHVMWVNKKAGQLSRQTPIEALTYAHSKTRDAFRDSSTYAETFELLDRLSGSEEPMANQEIQQNLDAKHPLNQILYGPPGTGKTYHTVDRALAIIGGERVREREEGDIERFRELRDSRQIAMVTFHQNFAYEDFIEGIRPVLDDGATSQIKYERHDGIFKRIAEAAKKEKDKRFVLIIDEINRGNIAKIFGELITLIEDSRRLGADDGTKVMLPYSKDSFGVPNNLYLIGTMNTADRSIQLLDTALRRRFDFVEMMPKPELISNNVEGVNCKRMLEEMNKRITVLLDRERQIGHTYLLGVDTMEKLSYAFQNKIFPLLQEYFFDDWSKIRAVLGQNHFVRDGDVPNLFWGLEQADEDRTIYERLPVDDLGWTDPEEYKKIYNAGNADDTSDR